MTERKKHTSKVLTVAGVIVAVLLIVVVAVSMAFRVSAIVYEGNTHYTDEEMTEFIFKGKYNTNAMVYFIFGNRQEKVEIPFVQDYDVEVMWPDRLKVTVYEKEIIGYIYYMGCNMYFDKDGIVVDSSQEILEGVPEVEGIEYHNIVLYEKLDTDNDEIFTIMLDIMQLFDKYEIIINKVSFDTGLNVSVQSGDVTISLGSLDGMTEKVHELGMIMPKLEGKKGTLYLNNFNEDTRAVIFTNEEDDDMDILEESTVSDDTSDVNENQ